MHTLSYILLTILVMATTSCKHATPTALQPLASSGAAESSKIQVSVLGSVQKPGKYTVPESSSLASLETRFGGLAGGRPQWVTVIRREGVRMEFRMSPLAETFAVQDG